ncbi:MFS transporter [Actinophytocola oryzae]|uniref:EmrB/QacA subfamily drug resistance transporter n=1 Tax=Actinophytocola oryzae TaxID=502181 RepID=A0A4R7W1I7_9PSEU|nr:MFS transporter [Actinophytocola oryzae]TDV56272.1 EmrB/QacA subfamily drug resistance transporter [Actinophytocola oryzae]
MTDTVAPARSRRAALYVLCAGQLMILLDATVVNVALPSIRADLGFTESGLAWVVNAYLVAFAGLLLLAGRLGDLLGQRRVFLTGLVVFTAASVLCGAAQTQFVLVAARFAQGVGGALASAVILGMIVTTFPEPKEQARAIGVYGFVSSAGGAVGLLAGGTITDVFNWHWIFLVNLPVGVLTVWLCLRHVEHRPGVTADGTDVTGAALLTAGLMLGVYAIVSAPVLGLGSVVLLVAFTLRQRYAANPLIPLRLFAARAAVVANVAQLLVVAGMFGVFFFGALYLQQVLGFSPLAVGLAFLPAAGTMALTALRLSGPVALRLGTRGAVLLSLGLILVCLLLWARTPAGGHYAVDVLPAMVLFGLGGGLGFPALMTLAMSGATETDSGAASGLFSTTYQVGGAVGLAALTTVAAGAADLNSGYHAAHLVAAGLVATALVLVAAGHSRTH